MRASEVIAGHGNTDFDAFASMLAARRLYPEATVALAGTVNRNVREFASLHADELGLVDASRLELDAIRRLIVVETVHATRLGELEPVARDSTVEKIVFDHHRDELEEWGDPATAVQSDDGALTTTMVGILAERELVPTPIEATAFALGIHEDTGSLTYPTSTQRDADALVWCLRHGARQDLLGGYLHTPLARNERELLHALTDALEPLDASGEEVLVAAITWPEYVEGVSNLAHKLVDLTDCRALLLLVEMEDRVFCVVRSRSEVIDAEAVARSLGGGGHRGAASAIVRGRLDDARRRALAALPHTAREAVRARDNGDTAVLGVKHQLPQLQQPRLLVARDNRATHDPFHRSVGELVPDRLVQVFAADRADKPVILDHEHAALAVSLAERHRAGHRLDRGHEPGRAGHDVAGAYSLPGCMR